MGALAELGYSQLGALAPSCRFLWFRFAPGLQIEGAVDVHHEIKLLFSFNTVILSIWLLSLVLPQGEKMIARAPDVTFMYQAETRRKCRWAKGMHFSRLN